MFPEMPNRVLCYGAAACSKFKVRKVRENTLASQWSKLRKRTGMCRGPEAVDYQYSVTIIISQVRAGPRR